MTFGLNSGHSDKSSPLRPFLAVYENKYKYENPHGHKIQPSNMPITPLESVIPSGEASKQTLNAARDYKQP